MKIEFISDGFREILLSDGMRDIVDQVSTEIQERANSNLTEDSEGYQKTVMQGHAGGGRWIGFVQTTDRASKIAEAEHNALSGAVT
jgi:hypothetical protein